MFRICSRLYLCMCYVYVFRRCSRTFFMSIYLLTVDLVFHVAFFCWYFSCVVFWCGSTTLGNNNLGFLRFWQDFRFVNLRRATCLQRRMLICQYNRHGLISGVNSRYNRPFAFLLLGVNEKKLGIYAHWGVISNFALLLNLKTQFYFTFPLIAYCGRAKGISV